MANRNLTVKMVLILLILLLISAFKSQSKAHRWIPSESWFNEPRLYERPKAGFVPNKEAAIAIGRTVMIGAYGKKFVKGLEPLGAKLFGDVWVVYSYFEPEGTTLGGKVLLAKGGVTTVEISKTSGSILNLTSER